MGDNIDYIHNEPASFRSQILQSFMALFKTKNVIERKMKKKKFSQKAASLPIALKRDFEIKITKNLGRQVWTFKPTKNVSRKVILYLHGGAYIFNILKYHWNLIEELLRNTNSTIVVPDYPLAPIAKCTDVYEYIEMIYNDLLAEFPHKDIIFMGDSAGGGMALGFAQELRNKSRKQPSQIILLSPWLDITMSNPAIKMVDRKDKILGVKGLQMAGESYAGAIDKKDFRVSPIYGNFYGLGKISIFIGTHDLFIADTERLKDLLNKKKVPINYFKYPKMFHAWAIFTELRESRHAINQMALLIE